MPKTNREWMESLTDEQLASFLTFGLFVRDLSVVGISGAEETHLASIQQICRRYVPSDLGLIDWFSKPQWYEVVDPADVQW